MLQLLPVPSLDQGLLSAVRCNRLPRRSWRWTAHAIKVVALRAAGIWRTRDAPACLPFQPRSGSGIVGGVDVATAATQELALGQLTPSRCLPACAGIGELAMLQLLPFQASNQVCHSRSVDGITGGHAEAAAWHSSRYQGSSPPWGIWRTRDAPLLPFQASIRVWS